MSQNSYMFDLDETIYMYQSEGYNDSTNHVCNLNKSVYWLKQAPRYLYKCFVEIMLNTRFNKNL